MQRPPKLWPARSSSPGRAAGALASKPTRIRAVKALVWGATPVTAIVACIVAAAPGCNRSTNPDAHASPATEPRTSPDRTPKPRSGMPSDDPPNPDAPKKACVRSLSLSSEASLLQEHRGHAKVHDFHERIEAAAITADHHPVELAAAWTVDDRPVLWFSPDYATVVVDRTVAEDLTVVEVPRLSAGQTQTVGRLTAAGLAGLSGRRWAELLLRARIIGTFVHIGSELCLSAEREGSGDYRVSVDGTHTYFTNDANEDPLHFDIAIAGDGTVTVTGRGGL